MAEFSPTQQRQLVMWVDQHSAGRNRITQNLIDLVKRLVSTLSGGVFYNQSRVDEVAQQIIVQVRAAQVSIADLTDAYLDQVLDVYEVPRTEHVTLPERLRDVDPLEEWRRPAEQYRYARSVDVPEVEAIEKALRRAEVLAATDLGLAHREAARQKLAPADKIRGYRRIIHPELSESKQSCGLCVAAADQFYYVADLMPIHEGTCNCTVLPVITGRPDPKNVSGLYEQLVKLTTQGGKTPLSKLRVEVRENGELGPVLTNSAHAFKDAEAAATDAA